MAVRRLKATLNQVVASRLLGEGRKLCSRAVQIARRVGLGLLASLLPFSVREGEASGTGLETARGFGVQPGGPCPSGGSSWGGELVI
jgi:hypothetical protein